jgi:hypothetical protein
MFGSDVLDVVIGIVFVYLTLSLICSAVQEMVASTLGLRARYLYRGILALLDDEQGTGLVRDFYGHPLISGLFPGEYEPGRTSNLPSYLPPLTFALALMDLAVPRGPTGEGSGATGATVPTLDSGPSASITVGGSLRLSLTRNSMPSKLKQALQILTDAANGDPAGTRANIEQWYNNAMERVSSAYKRRTQAIILAVGLVVAAAANADSIGIVTMLSTSKAVRDSLVAASSQIAATRESSHGTGPLTSGAATGASGSSGGNLDIPDTKGASQSPASASLDQELDLNLSRIRNSGFPLGWARHAAAGDFRALPTSQWGWVQKVVGILLTIAAISLGAPFWFDVLNKVTVIRSAIKPAQSQADTK